MSDVGRRLVRDVVIDLDFCSRRYGQEPCSPYPAETVLSLDSTSGWSALNAATINIGTSATCKEGAASITFDKDAGAIACGIANTALTPFDWDFSYLCYWIYFSSVADIDFISNRVGQDGTANYWRWDIDVSVLSAGWNFIRLDREQQGAGVTFSTVGSPSTSAIDAMRFAVQFNAAGNTLAGILVDWVTKHTRTLGTECYNTASTCDDPSNYDPEPKSYRFVQPGDPLPTGEAFFGHVLSVPTVAGEIDMRRGLGGRDTITVELADFEHGDEVVDPYRHLRGDRVNPGHALRKWAARNPFHQNRPMTVRTGEVDESGFLYQPDMLEQTYYLDAIKRLASGNYQAVARDILSRSHLKKIPEPSTGELSATLAAGASSCTVKSGQGAQYGTAPFYFRADNEIILCGARTDDTLSSLTRAQYGTTDAEHAADSRIQKCKAWSNATLSEIWADVLEEFYGIDATLIDSTGADAECAKWFKRTLSPIASEPTEVETFLRDLLEQFNCVYWWDPFEQLVKFLVNHPREPGQTITTIDDNDIVGGKVQESREDDARITRCTMWYGVADWSRKVTTQDKDRPAFLRSAGYIDTDLEHVHQMGDVKNRLIYAWAMPSGASAMAKTTVYRLVNQFGIPPRRFAFTVPSHVGRTLRLGQEIDFSTEQCEDEYGAPLDAIQCRVVRLVPPVELSQGYQVTLRETGFGHDSHGFWAPAGTGDHPLDDEWMHWADGTTGLMPDGSDPDRWI